MKKFAFIVLIIAILILMLAPSKNANDPYAGTYLYNGNTNVVLVLKTDKTFELINTFDKNTESFYGKYSINDNKLDLNFDNPNIKKQFPQIADCRFNGTTIVLEGSKNVFYLQR